MAEAPPGNPIDPETGYEYFYWGLSHVPKEKWQKRYKCPLHWETGARCEYDTHDLEMMAIHVSQPHTLDGKPKPTGRDVLSPVVDFEGKPIIHRFQEPEVPAELRGARFKKEA